MSKAMSYNDDHIFNCPRCGNPYRNDYDSSFDCEICGLEFEKEDFDLYDEEDILSIEEKSRIVKDI